MINNVLAANYFNFFQAKHMRQATFVLAADELEHGWLNQPAVPDAVKQAMRTRLDEYRKTVGALRVRAGDPRRQEGAAGAGARARGEARPSR